MDEEQKRFRYNFIYQNLVESQEDFVGLVAYSLYKQEKIAYVKQFEEKNGRPPDINELKEFHTITNCRILQYKELAETRVNYFLSNIYKAQSEQLEQEYKNRLIASLKDAKVSLWSGILHSALGSFFATIIIGFIIVCTLYSQHGITWLLQQILHAADIAPK